MDNWTTELQKQIAYLELIASWASQVGYGRVRDHIRMATYELRQQIKMRQEMLDASKQLDLRECRTP